MNWIEFMIFCYAIFWDTCVFYYNIIKEWKIEITKYLLKIISGTPQEVKEVITNAIIETLHLEIIITEGEVLEIWSIPVLDKNMITAEINAVTALRIDMVSNLVIFH